MTSLLDLPLISEMDDIEKSARRGDKKVLEYIYNSLPVIKRVYVDRLMRNDGKTMREALDHAGVSIVCMR